MRRVEKVVRQEEDGGMTQDDEGEETLAGSDKNPEKEASGNGLVQVVAGNGEARTKNGYCRITQPDIADNKAVPGKWLKNSPLQLGQRRKSLRRKEKENVCSVPFEGCSEGRTPYILNVYGVPAASGTMRFYLTTVFLHCLSK